MCYHLKANFLLYKSHLSPNPAQSTLSPRRVTDVDQGTIDPQGKKQPFLTLSKYIV